MSTDTQKNLIVLQRLEGNDPTHVKGMQVWLAPHTDVIIMFWWALWVGTLLMVLRRLVLAWRKS